MIADFDEEVKFHNFHCVWCGENGIVGLIARAGVGFTCPECEAIYVQLEPDLALEWIEMPEDEQDSGITELEGDHAV